MPVSAKFCFGTVRGKNSQVIGYQKGKTNLDFTEATNSIKNPMKIKGKQTKLATCGK